MLDKKGCAIEVPTMTEMQMDYIEEGENK